ncbi:MAG TPA: class I SAM-dependent methyltransferase [Cyanobacteria bacterium UBA8156]|jgi:SAM-dependent methyltransferase|nr:class I SAM-dependent methyltransferase [Cyanobacteria bacterium UBA8156]
MSLNATTVYTNAGNPTVLKLLDGSDRRILDVGCGAGDTGHLIRQTLGAEVTGFTCSAAEQAIAQTKLDRCAVGDLEGEVWPELAPPYDAICCLHVLEHLVNPVAVLRRLLPLLAPQGKLVIAVPNLAFWRERAKLLRGRFDYTDGGTLDRTHLRFYTFFSAQRELCDPIPELVLEQHFAVGSVPLGFFRHHWLSNSLKQTLDRWGERARPNLFGGEIWLVARKQDHA